jgi:hypothetical protein
VACIVLAAKTEESPKKINAVIGECHRLKMRGIAAAGGRMSGAPAASGGSGTPPTAAATAATLEEHGKDFKKLKERILLLERVLLHTIGFELSIDHPYKFLVEQIKRLVTARKIEFSAATEKLSPPQLRDKLMNQMVQWCVRASLCARV